MNSRDTGLLAILCRGMRAGRCDSRAAYLAEQHTISTTAEAKEEVEEEEEEDEEVV